MDLDEARDDGVLGCCGIIWTICKQSAPRSRQITTPTCHHSNFYMPIAKSNLKKNTFFTLVAASAAVQRECAAERERAFRCSAPAVWNSLPQTDSVAVFKLRLKTFLFSQAFSSFSAHYHAA